jgi:integrase
MPRLTDAAVKRLPKPAAGNRLTFDDAVAGFAARVTASGHRGFVLNYETREGRQRRYTIGSLGDWTASDARAEARQLRQVIDQGEDPMAEIEAERAAPTMAELCDRFEQEHLPRKRPGTADDYRQMLDNHIRPHLGRHTKVADVRFADVEALHRKITRSGATYAANRCTAIVSKMFSLAVRWGYRETNPARGVERNTEYRRQRYLTADELVRLLQALAGHHDRQAANIIRVLLMSGARRGEVLAMRWADLDLTAGTWSKPASSTKQKEAHTVPLSAPARQLLSEIHKQQRPRGKYVFPSTGKTGHVTEPKKFWAALCKAAGISGLRIHDLRHSFASQLASGGASLPLIGALLGHSNPTTTQRYAHLFQDPQRAAVERVAAVITAAESPRPSKVEKLTRKST